VDSIQTIDANNLHIHIGGFVNFGGFYIRPMGPYEKGAVNQGHEHQIDHCMHLVKGSVSVSWRAPNGETGIVEVLEPRAKLSIRKDYWHEITALEDKTEWECWFAKAEADRVYGDANAVDWTM
jgi:hypothetical protein